MLVAQRVQQNGGTVPFEWPEGNDGFHNPTFLKAFQTLNTESAVVHGCMVGVKSIKNGMPIAKPWRVETTHPKLREALDNLRCDKSHEHQRCEGQDTKQSEDYPDKLARITLRNLERDECAHDVREIQPEDNVLAITKQEEKAWEQLDKNTQNTFPPAAQKIHANTGHRNVEAIAKLLRQKGAPSHHEQPWRK